MSGVLHSIPITDADIARAAEVLSEVPGLADWFRCIARDFQEDLLSVGVILAEERRRREHGPGC